MKKAPLLLVAVLSFSLALAACGKTPAAVHPKFGKEVWVAVSGLSGTVDSAVNGAAIGHFFEQGKYIVGIQLNIDKAPKGKMYNVWLEKEGTTDYVYVGELISPTGDVRHVLTAEFDKDYRDYKNVVVTVQNDGKAPTVPGSVVARGTLEAAKS